MLNIFFFAIKFLSIAFNKNYLFKPPEKIAVSGFRASMKREQTEV